ncbi:MAG: hypothetical protein OXI86_07215, partial [Candidatus Poribacteria bacterium]|nr:hypothetical protein [Candidatus Poribacteria bacterium]
CLTVVDAVKQAEHATRSHKNYCGDSREMINFQSWLPLKRSGVARALNNHSRVNLHVLTCG